jgi:hypothetical protein
MLTALLAVLGVDLIVVVLLLAGMQGRKRWVKRQPGAFRGQIRVADGELDGLGPKWRRGYGRWVRDVFVWTKAPLLFRNELLPVDRLEGERSEPSDQIKRLGDGPVVIGLKAGVAIVEIAAAAEDRALLLGPYDRDRSSEPNRRTKGDANGNRTSSAPSAGFPTP